MILMTAMMNLKLMQMNFVYLGDNIDSESEDDEAADDSDTDEDEAEQVRIPRKH